MISPILVTYATCTGSTIGVAEAIGKTLSGQGLPVEVHPMSEVHDLSPYGAVIAGSAIQGKAWLPEAVRWVEDHRAALAEQPFAAFLVCMTLVIRDDEEIRAEVAHWLDPIASLVEPCSRGLFAGVLDIRRMPNWQARIGFRLSVLLGVWKEGDHRNWPAIETWAASLPPLLIT